MPANGFTMLDLLTLAPLPGRIMRLLLRAGSNDALTAVQLAENLRLPAEQVEHALAELVDVGWVQLEPPSRHTMVEAAQYRVHYGRTSSNAHNHGVWKLMALETNLAVRRWLPNLMATKAPAAAAAESDGLDGLMRRGGKRRLSSDLWSKLDGGSGDEAKKTTKSPRNLLDDTF